MTITATEKKLLASANLRDKGDINPDVYKMVDNNLSSILNDDLCSGVYQEKTKTTYLDFSTIGLYIIIFKHSVSEGYKTAVSCFKIALSEFEAVTA